MQLEIRVLIEVVLVDLEVVQMVVGRALMVQVWPGLAQVVVWKAGVEKPYIAGVEVGTHVAAAEGVDLGIGYIQALVAVPVQLGDDFVELTYVAVEACVLAVVDEIGEVAYGLVVGVACVFVVEQACGVGEGDDPVELADGLEEVAYEFAVASVHPAVELGLVSTCKQVCDIVDHLSVLSFASIQQPSAKMRYFLEYIELVVQVDLDNVVEFDLD